MAETFSVLAAFGVLLIVFFAAGLTFSYAKKKPEKFWVIGLIVSIFVTLIFYAISFLGILQLYNLTSR